jgi:hypothetical protein
MVPPTAVGLPPATVKWEVCEWGALLHPLLHDLHFVERVGSESALAMIHARRHEQSDGIRGLVLADGLQNVFVIDHAVKWIDLLIGPAVIHQKFAAAVEERLEVRIARVQRTVVGGGGDVGREIILCGSTCQVLKNMLRIRRGDDALFETAENAQPNSDPGIR